MRTSKKTHVSICPRDSQPAVVPEQCVNCGADLPTPFCAQCGEKRASDRQYSLRQFGEELLETFAHLDGSFLRTLHTLVARPGELTAGYMRGERIRYTKALQLFVLVSLAYFGVSLATNVHTFDVPLRYQIAQSTRPGRMVTQRVAERHTTLERYTELFDHTSTTQAKTLIILMVPGFAMLVAAVECRKRRYALQHLIFALHTYTALLLVLMVLNLLLFPPMLFFLQRGAALLRTSVEGMISLLVVAAVAAYLCPAVARAYDDGRLSAILKTGVLILGMALIALAYRVLLFYTVFWAT